MRKKTLLKITLGIAAILIGVAVALLPKNTPQKHKSTENANTATPTASVLAYERMAASPTLYAEVDSTEALRTLLQNAPDSIVLNFPPDFASNGNEELFFATLRPIFERQNKLLIAERQAMLDIAEKINKNIPLTSHDTDVWNYFVKKYESLDRDFSGQYRTLYARMDEVSIGLGLAQAIIATENGKTHLNAPFDLFRWKSDDDYARVEYLSLPEAVADYAYALNSGYAYYPMHVARAIHRGKTNQVQGPTYARGVKSYKYEDKDYVPHIIEAYKKYDLYRFDDKGE